MENHSRGTFIVFEGPDFSGKTTQAKILHDALVKEGYEVVLTREPGDSSIGPQVRSIMLDDESVNLTPMAELMLVMGERAQHIEEVIEPALEQGKIVICDRFVDSSIAYQGFGKGLNVDQCYRLAHWVTDKHDPDLTLYMNADYEQVLERAGDQRRDKMESLGREFHEKVRQGFRDASEFRSPWHKLLVPSGNFDAAQKLILGKALAVIRGERQV